MQSKIDIDMDNEESVQQGIHFYQIQSVISILIDLIILYFIWGYLKLDIDNELRVIIIAFVFVIPLISLLSRLFKIIRLKNRLAELQKKDLTKYHLEKHALTAQKLMASNSKKSTIAELLFNYFKHMYPNLEKLKIQTKDTDQVKSSSSAPLLVRINGKEVEVGPGRKHKKDCGCIGKLFQSLAEHTHNQESCLTINGHKVNMNDPDDVQKAIKSCRIIGGIIICFACVFLLIITQKVGWMNWGDDALGGIIALSVWFLAGAILTFLTPRTLEKRLQELKRQGKIPSKY